MLKQSIHAAAKKMKIDFEEVTESINHMGERGGSREEILLTYLRKYIPNKYDMSNGVIIDGTGEQSKQQDIIIYDSFNSPVLLNMQSTKMVPIESVFSVVEVKSSLNKSEINKCVNNILSVKSLSKDSLGGTDLPTAGFVFSFTSSTSLEALLDNLVEANEQVEKTKQISVICVLDKGLIVNISKKGLKDITLLPDENSTTALIKNTAENNLMLFYLILMQYLNQTSLAIPNLLKYASSGELINIEYSIPNKHIPLDSHYEFGEGKVELDTVKSIMEDSDLLKKIQNKSATEEDILIYFSKQLENILYLASNFTGGISHTTIDFMGKKYLISQIKQIILIFNKINNKEEVSESELQLYNEGKDDLYRQYLSQ